LRDVGAWLEPFELPSWPELLPRIEMPLAMQADRLIIDGFAISRYTPT
jgi:translocation and assembly module TamB